MDDERIDRELGDVFRELVELVKETRQVLWSAPRGQVRAHLEELQSFLADNVAVVADAEERIGGRSPTLLSPTAMTRPDLRGQAGDRPEAMVSLLRANLEATVGDIRARVAHLGGGEDVELLSRVADGLDERVVGLAGSG
jgi:hypothetical protein